MFFRQLLLWPVIGLCSIAQADQVWTLPIILKHAGENSPLLKASEQSVVQAENLAHQAARWDNPEVSASSGPYKENGIKGSATSATVTQSVPLFGQKGLAAKIGREEQALRESEKSMMQLFLQHEIVRLTYRFAALIEQEKHIAHRRERLNLVRKYLKSRPFASPSQNIEKNLLENRFREIEEKFAEVIADKQKAWQVLNIYLNLNEPITPKLNWYSNPVNPDRQALKEAASIGNPELGRQSHLVASAQLQGELAGKKAYPEVRLGASYYSQVVGQDDQKFYAPVVELSIPIWNRGSYASRAARAQTEAEKYKLESKKREINSEFEQAWARLDEAKTKVELFPQSLIEILEKQMTVAEQNWRKGLVNVIAFLELEAQVHEQTDKIYNSQANYVQALSQLLIISGQPFDLGKN